MTSAAEVAKQESLRWWKRASLTAKTLVVFALALGPLAVATLLLGILNERGARLDDDIHQHRETRLNATEVLNLVVDAETGVRGFLLTSDPAFLEPYRQARVLLPPLLDEMEAHDTANHSAEPAGRDRPRIHEAAGRQMQVLADLLDTGYSKRLLEREKRFMDRFRSDIGALIEAEAAEVEVLDAERQRETDLARFVLIGGISLSTLGGLLGGLLLMRGIVRRVGVVTENARRLAQGEELHPFEGGSDEIAQLATMLSDSAELLRARENDLRLAKLEADAANSAKSQFLSRMSHELRTPLNAILGFAAVARSEANGEVARDLDQIHLAGRHLLDLINEVLDISRIEAGELSLSVEPVAVAEVVDEAVALLSGAAASRSIRLTTDDGCNGSTYAFVDRQRFKQVLVNLLSNGVKYNHDGGEVRISCVRMDSMLRVIVADTGPGLPSGSVEEVFRPFARLGAEMTDIEGTGLGLALSRSLMRSMGGDVEVGSTSSTGTEFWIEMRAAEQPAVLSENERVFDRPVHAIGTSPIRGSVLQVEDNPSNIRLVNRIMQRRPHVHLVTTQFGSQAVELAKELRPDVILLDVNLPDISGREVLARLRSEPETRDMRIVMLSADATDGQIANLLESGATEYLTKPIDVGALLATIDEAVGLREAG